jgi:hypothetical protein
MIKKLTLVFSIFILSSNLYAQKATSYLSPVPSPQAFVSQNVGMTKISVSYSSPGMKGREVFGGLVPYDEEWRAGANSPTLISFSTDVSVSGKTLRAGKYVIRMTPKKDGNWVVNLNLRNIADRPPSLWKEGAVGFPYDYYKDGKVDMKSFKKDMSHSFEVAPVTWEANIERLFYRIDPNDNKTAKISMLWENVIIQFDVDTMTEEHLERFSKTLESN